MKTRHKPRSAFYSCTFIINPTRFPEYAKMLKRILKRTDVPIIIESTSKEHFIESVRDFFHSTHRYLLVWGGDGTAHDAINTLVEESTKHPELKKAKSVGFLRGGSGNGIQDSYEVPFGIKKQVAVYAEAMQNDYTIEVDLLQTRCNGVSSYCQLIGFGFDADVLKNRARRVYRRGRQRGQVRRGMRTYMLSILSTYLFGYRELQNRVMTLDLFDGKYSYKGTRVNAEFPFEYLRRLSNAIEIEVGTRPYYGRLFKICPDVVCNDGYLDIYLFNLESRISIILNAMWLWMGRHDRINKKLARGNKAIIERYEVKRASISTGEQFEYHVDGEVRITEPDENGRHEVEIRVLPGEISFIVPPVFYRKFHPIDLM